MLFAVVERATADQRALANYQMRVIRRVDVSWRRRVAGGARMGQREIYVKPLSKSALSQSYANPISRPSKEI